jgi:hypothetical protein
MIVQISNTMADTNLSIYMEYNSDNDSSDYSVESMDYDPIAICFVDTTINSSTVCAGGDKSQIKEDMNWNFKYSDGTHHSITARNGMLEGFELPSTDRVFFAGTFIQNLKPLHRMGYKFKYGSAVEDVKLWPINAKEEAQIEFCQSNPYLMGSSGVEFSTLIQDMNFAIVLLH